MLSSQLAHEPHGWLLEALAGSSGAPKTTTNGADAKRLAALEKRVKRLEDREQAARAPHYEPLERPPTVFLQGGSPTTTMDGPCATVANF